MTPAYRYRCDLVRVIDADTLVLRVDLGFHCAITIPVRIHGVDAPELRTTAGDEAKAFVVRLLELNPVLVIESYKDQQTFARWVADVYVGDKLLADILRETGRVKS